MCEYFGLDPQLLEVEDDMFPRFLRGLPKYRLQCLLSVLCRLGVW